MSHDEGERSDKGRWSSRRKTEIVLRLFRGETLDALSRELGVTPGTLAEWRDEALAGMQAGSSRESPTTATASSTTSRPRSATRPCRSSSSRRRLRSGRTDSALHRGGRRCEPGDVTLREKPYGILRVCRAWRLSRATVQRHKALADGAPRIPAKRGPKTFLSDEQVLAEIRAVLASTPFVGEGHRKVWAWLRQERGVRSSMRRILRIMRQHGILACDRPTGVRGPDTHDRTITTKTRDEMWAIDATGCLTDEGNAAVFVVVDHCTGECLGVRAARRGTRFEAIECLREAIHSAKGRYEVEIAQGTKLRHDHGSQFISHAFQDELKTLGIESSPSFVRQPEGNGCVERFIRTLKEQLLWLQRFRTAEELDQVLRDFARRFNNHWIIGRIGDRTPAAHRRILLGEAA
ncbi:MAG: IS3 family transposase [Phycisphaerales bacterium]